VPVRLAEITVRVASGYDKADCLSRLGMALYRAGRCDEAIRRLEEAIQTRGGAGASIPDDWEFLTLAHHRLRHREESHRWLNRLRDYRPSESPDRFWQEMVIRLLRSEAEAVILYDPIFPADPFAR
jgi:hypothetical protein